MTDIRPELPAIVLGLSPTGLHVVRALGRTGVEVHGVAEPNQSGSTSRYLASVTQPADDAALLAHLHGLSRDFEGRGIARAVIIPTSDQHVEFVLRHLSDLEDRFLFQDSYRDGLAASIMAKDSFYRLCEQHSVKYPVLRETSADGLPACVGSIPFPWIVKPAEIHLVKREMRGEKGWIVRNAAELQATIPKIPAGAQTLLVQEIVPGPESNITLCCGWFEGDGTVRQMFTARKLRQYPPGFGSASLVQSCPELESAAIMQRLLFGIDYRGVAAAEFKRHPDTGELSIIEINVRPSLWFSISEDAGRPVVLETYRTLAGMPSLSEAPQRDGVRWRYWVKDIASATFYRRQSGFVLPPPDLDAVGPATKQISAVHAKDDPRPYSSEFVFLLRKGLARASRLLVKPKSE
ncbi:carboxylate--amine ligase [Qipengyuania sp. CAU 1752]